jgi:hypothetical protein
VAVEEPPAGTLLKRRQLRPGVLEASSERKCAMRVHIDRQWLAWLDGDMITFVVITLIIVIALVY